MGACEEMMSVWLEGREGVRQPLTWATLLAALKETGEFETLVSHIENEIK